MRRCLAFVAAVLVAGCAGSYRPIVDTKGADMSNYEQDLAECRGYASQVSPVGTAAGYLLGGHLGATHGWRFPFYARAKSPSRTARKDKKR